MTDNARIHKAQGLEREFVILRNKDVQRTDLSYEAIGMLVYLMSLPTDWEIYVSQLKRDGHAGRDKVRRILSELEDNGYISVRQTKNDDGTFGVNEYHAYATPEMNPDYQPLTGNPLTDSPHTENPQLQRKEDTKKTLTNTAPADESTDAEYTVREWKDKILDALTQQPVHADTLAKRIGVQVIHAIETPQNCWNALKLLEQRGDVVVQSGKYALNSELQGSVPNEGFKALKRAISRDMRVSDGQATTLASLLNGTSKKFAESSAPFRDNPAFPDEVSAFVQYWHDTGLHLPTTPDKLSTHFLRWREDVAAAASKQEAAKFKPAEQVSADDATSALEALRRRKANGS